MIGYDLLSDKRLQSLSEYTLRHKGIVYIINAYTLIEAWDIIYSNLKTNR